MPTNVEIKIHTAYLQCLSIFHCKHAIIAFVAITLPVKVPSLQHGVTFPATSFLEKTLTLFLLKTRQFQNFPSWNYFILISAAGSPSWTRGACTSFFAATTGAAWSSLRATIQKRYSRHDLFHIAASTMTTSDWTIFPYAHEKLCDGAACFTPVLINWHFLSPLTHTSWKHEILIFKTEIAPKSRFTTVQRHYSLSEIWPFAWIYHHCFLSLQR